MAGARFFRTERELFAELIEKTRILLAIYFLVSNTAIHAERSKKSLRLAVC